MTVVSKRETINDNVEKTTVSSAVAKAIGIPSLKISPHFSNFTFSFSNILYLFILGFVNTINNAIKNSTVYVTETATAFPAPPSSGIPNFPKMKL